MLEQKYITEVMQSLSKQKERLLLDQLGELVSRNLLVIEEGQPVILREENFGDYKFKLEQTVRFVLKDQEYIEKLEAENEMLRKLVGEDQ